MTEEIEEGWTSPVDVIICDICKQVAAHPELRGTHWGRKDGTGVYSIAWSASLIQHAGGIDRLFAEWEQRK